MPADRALDLSDETFADLFRVADFGACDIGEERDLLELMGRGLSPYLQL